MNYNLNNKGLNEAVRELNERVTKLEHSMSTPAPDNYMVTVEDLMARIKSRDDRIEALKLDNECMKMSIDDFISEKNDWYLMNSRLEEQCRKMEAEIRHFNEEITALNKENGELKKGALIDSLTKIIKGLEEEKDLLVKALNIYQKYMIVDVFSDGVTIFRLDNPDGIGRIIVNDHEVGNTLTNTWIKFYQPFKYHDVNDEQPKKKVGENKCSDYKECDKCPLRLINCYGNGTLYEILDKTFEYNDVDTDNPIYKVLRAELVKEVK